MTDYQSKDQLFIRYINDECTKEEIQRINRDFSLKEQRKIIDNILVNSWNSGENTNQPEKFQKMLIEIHQKIESKSGKKQLIDYLYYSKVAASLLIFVSVLGYFVINYSPLPEQQPEIVNTIHKSTEFGQKLTINLPDNSIVVLNYGTTLSYPEKFSDSIRHVKLNGEAFFEITHDDQKPFIVEGNGVNVTVLGTSFNFNTRETFVALQEGKVKLTADKQNAFLSPGQIASLSEKSESFVTREFDHTEIIGWKDGIINIENFTLEQVINTLQKWYGVSITVSDIDLEKRFSGKLSNKSLRNILEGISFTIDCQFKINGKNVKLYK